MPAIACPYTGCTFVTDDLESDAIAIILKMHNDATHSAPQSSTATAAAKVEKVRRPTVSSAGTTEEWAYFLTRWQEYATATKISGADRTFQLLECCDEPLRKDLTRAAGGSLTGQTEEKILKALELVSHLIEKGHNKLRVRVK